MPRFLVVPLFLFLPLIALAQNDERLFCAQCGKQNELVFSFCYFCGSRLDKEALVSRLKARVTAAESLTERLTFTPTELTVLVHYEAEAKARELLRSGVKLQPSRPKTQVEKTLDVVAPILVGTTAIFLMRQAFK